MKNYYYKTLIIILLIAASFGANAQSTPTDLVFQIKVSTDIQNNQISLSWNKLVNVTGYKVYRKIKGASNFTFITNKLYNDNFFIDNNVPAGVAYEYAIYASHTNDISGYVCAGMNIDVKHSQGNVLLVIDSNYIVPASNEIELFKRDLIKDGWKVLVQYAGRGEDPSVVKNRISSCNSASSIEGVILLGHIPVPYSGNIAPDAHSDHIGAWPADIYYGDMCASVNNMWHDAVLVNTSASSIRNHNVVGDGKYDISSIASSTSTKIFVGRIDVSNMSTISTDDVALFKQYINKNHAYKSSTKKFKMQGLIDDNFGYFYGEAFAQNGWRNLSSLVGPDNVVEGDYMTDMKNDSYLWSYACGGGWNTGATGVGTTQSFKSNQIESVFTMLYGSYFGDWDVSNNFLRAPIASPSSTLVSFWAGRPNWFMHNMSLGEPIGYSFLNTVDNVNSYFPKGYANAQIHQSIQGDPTLKMYMYEAPTGLEAFETSNGNNVKLQWQASVDQDVVGYYIYRASNVNGDFQLLNNNPVTTLEFVDTNPIPSSNSLASAAYMVRAVKLEQTETGSFYNLSPGEITEGFSTNAPLPVTVSDFAGIQTGETNTLFWEVQKEENINFYEIEKSADLASFASMCQVAAVADEGGAHDYELVDEAPALDNYYRLKIVDYNGNITYHNKVVRIKREVKQVTQATIFPNPAVSAINLQIPDLVEGDDLTVLIYDMRGRAVLSTKIIQAQDQNIKLDINKLNVGQYIVRYVNETSRAVNSLKFIKIN